jgi:hypothetical protein
MSEDPYERDVKKLFERMAEHLQGADSGSKAMFSMLVRTALRYRDILMHSSGSPLTVGETRAALAAFMEVMKTHAIPPALDKRVHGLVVMWLEELKETIHH